jgi:hypothetical protein
MEIAWSFLVEKPADKVISLLACVLVGIDRLLI